MPIERLQRVSNGVGSTCLNMLKPPLFEQPLLGSEGYGLAGSPSLAQPVSPTNSSLSRRPWCPWHASPRPEHTSAPQSGLATRRWIVSTTLVGYGSTLNHQRDYRSQSMFPFTRSVHFGVTPCLTHGQFSTRLWLSHCNQPWVGSSQRKPCNTPAIRLTHLRPEMGRGPSSFLFTKTCQFGTRRTSVKKNHSHRQCILWLPRQEDLSPMWKQRLGHPILAQKRCSKPQDQTKKNWPTSTLACVFFWSWF